MGPGRILLYFFIRVWPRSVHTGAAGPASKLHGTHKRAQRVAKGWWRQRHARAPYPRFIVPSPPPPPPWPPWPPLSPLPPSPPPTPPLSSPLPTSPAPPETQHRRPLATTFHRRRSRLHHHHRHLGCRLHRCHHRQSSRFISTRLEMVQHDPSNASPARPLTSARSTIACADSTFGVWIVPNKICCCSWWTDGSWPLGWSRTRPEAADLLRACCCCIRSRMPLRQP